jgi:hypothetical protein
MCVDQHQLVVLLSEKRILTLLKPAGHGNKWAKSSEKRGKLQHRQTAEQGQWQSV